MRRDGLAFYLDKRRHLRVDHRCSSSPGIRNLQRSARPTEPMIARLALLFSNEKTAHPVSFDVEYAARLNPPHERSPRVILAAPQLIVAGLLLYAQSPDDHRRAQRALHGPLSEGPLRIQRRVAALGSEGGSLLRSSATSTPPFSFEPGASPVTLGIERAARQSRWQLLLRFFAGLFLTPCSLSACFRCWSRR